MNLKEQLVIVLSSLMLVLLFIGCQSKTELSENQFGESGRRSKRYVKAIMTHYVAPDPRNMNLLPAPPEGNSFFTVGAAYKGDSLQVLLSTVKELVGMSKLAGLPTDSASIASIVNGDNLLILNAEAFRIATTIKPYASVDSLKSQGKQHIINYYFSENGYQRKQLSPSEQAYLIDSLSDLGILVYWDDYIGTYHIVELAQ
jgi:hypothetical protein